MTTKPTRKAAGTRKATTPKPVDDNATAESLVGAIVEASFEDVPTASTVTTVGIVTDVTDDGIYVAPLSAAAVFPPDQVRVL